MQVHAYLLCLDDTAKGPEAGCPDLPAREGRYRSYAKDLTATLPNTRRSGCLSRWPSFDLEHQLHRLEAWYSPSASASGRGLRPGQARVHRRHFAISALAALAAGVTTHALSLRRGRDHSGRTKAACTAGTVNILA